MSVLVTSHRHCSRQPFEDSRLIVDDRSRHKSAGVAVRCVAVQCSACGAVRTCVGVADVHDDLALLLGQYGHSASAARHQATCRQVGARMGARWVRVARWVYGWVPGGCMLPGGCTDGCQ
eukprot:1187743-Prorocentrum_minimum.AAC.1